MKLEVVFIIAVLTAFKDVSRNFVESKSIQAESLKSEVEVSINCSLENLSKDCFVVEGRRRVGTNHFNTTRRSVEGIQDESFESRRRGKKKGHKKIKKAFKKMTPMLIGLGALKLLVYHLIMKKMAFFTFISFLLSKVSFILASLVALKQFFHTPTQHRSAENNKLEVVHIPIRKLRHNKHKEKDAYYDESQFIPVTFEPETVFDTTPINYDFPYRQNIPETFTSSEEDFNGNTDGRLDDHLNEIYNEHFRDTQSSSLDRSDTHDEKKYYKYHVHSPFV